MKLFKVTFNVQLGEQVIEDNMFVVHDTEGQALQAAINFAEALKTTATPKMVAELPQGSILFQVGAEMIPNPEQEDEVPLITLVGDGGKAVN